MRIDCSDLIVFLMIDKADKKVEKEKAYRAEQERQEREEELRGLAVKLRQR